MASFLSDGVQIAFDDITPDDGANRTVVLIHGFASNRIEGWKRTGWYAAFERRRTRVIAPDQRGHGEERRALATRRPTSASAWPPTCST